MYIHYREAHYNIQSLIFHSWTHTQLNTKLQSSLQFCIALYILQNQTLNPYIISLYLSHKCYKEMKA